MVSPVVEPQRVRVDLLLLRPDMSRPGIVMRMHRGSAWAADDAEPRLVVERLERGLAAVAWMYRWMLAGVAALMLSPVLLAWAAWSALWVLPYPLYEPFQRGYYFPGLALYEAVAFVVLAAIIMLISGVFAGGLGVLRSMSSDYRHLSEETSEEWLSGVVDEAASGQWPRAAALLTTAASFSSLGRMIDAARPQGPDVSAPDEAGDR